MAETLTGMARLGRYRRRVTPAPFVVGPRVQTSDGVEIATYDLGGHGPPVLLVHATGFHGRVWLPVAAALGDRYHCWSLDSRGHGDSAPAPGGDYAWEGFAEDVLAVRQRLGWEHPAAVGHSSGGAALLLAEEARPGTFAALYCYEPVVPIGPAPPGGPSGSSPGQVLADGARRRREVFASRDQARANYAAKAPFSEFDPAALAAYIKWGFHDLADGTVRLACRRQDEARVYEAAVRHHGFRDLGLVACPVTVAAGGRQAHFGPGAMTAVAARLGGSRPVEVHPDLGHFGPLQRPAEVAASIVEALGAMAAG
jgi:pimeloyl-ACP methyl ester carboxylesterase